MTKKKASKKGGSGLSKARLKEREAIDKCLARRKGRVDIASMFGFPPKADRPQTSAKTAPASLPKTPPTQVPGKAVTLDQEKRDNIPRPRESYIAIPKELFDQGLIGEIVGACKGIVPAMVWLLMYRWSYGFGRNYTQISLPEIVRCLGISRRAAVYALRALEGTGYIRKYEIKNGQRATYIVGRPIPTRE